MFKLKTEKQARSMLKQARTFLSRLAKKKKKQVARLRLAKALANGGSPPILVATLETGPKGRRRYRLLAALCRTAANADKALSSKANLSLKERIRLVKRALDTSGSYERCRRAKRYLGDHKDWPQEIRDLLVKSAASGPSWDQIPAYILKNPDDYFPAHAPMTDAERSLLIKKLLLRGLSCVDVLIEYGHEKHHDSFPVSKEEAKCAVPRAIECLCSDTRHHEDADAILRNKKAVDLLSPEQASKLKELVRKAA